MFDRRFFAEAVTLIILAAICGSVANVVAARDRQLAPVGTYPNATVVPQRAPAPDPAPPVSDTTETAAMPDVDPAETETEAVATSTAVVIPTPTPPAAQTAPSATFSSAATSTTATTPEAPKPAPKPAKQFTPTPDKVSVDITNEDARQLFDQGAVFLDARRTGAYLEGHIPGAKSFAVWEADVDEKVNALFYELTDQRQPIVVYCTGGNCEDSHMLAQKLWGIGYENVLVYTDGFPGWLSISGPVER